MSNGGHAKLSKLECSVANRYNVRRSLVPPSRLVEAVAARGLFAIGTLRVPDVNSGWNSAVGICAILC